MGEVRVILILFQANRTDHFESEELSISLK
jgi:hypothetical protein